MKPIYIYGLQDPVSGIIRYIGKTVMMPEARFNGHVLKSMRWNPDNEELAEWINGLIFRGKLPRIRILATANETNWQQKECECIAEFAETEQLLNKRGGGSGGKTSKLSKTEKTVSVAVFMTASQAKSLRTVAAKAGKSLSAFLRESALASV